MARKGLSYYYVSNNPRRWTPLGRDLAAAKAEWARLEAGGGRITVADLIDRFIAGHAGSENTRRQYRTWARVIAAEFPVYADVLTAQHLAVWRDKNKALAPTINGCLAVISGAFAKGHEWGLVPGPLSVKRLPTKTRDRYMTDEEFRSIRKAAPDWLKVAMDLAYLTSSRPVDIRKLRWAKVGVAVEIRQMKTGAWQAFDLTPEIQEVLTAARGARVVGLYVVSDGKGGQISKGRLERHFRAAAQGIEDIQFRDIRAKGATDAKRLGQDYQALLGHTSKRMSERYIKDRQPVKTEPLRRKL